MAGKNFEGRLEISGEAFEADYNDQKRVVVTDRHGHTIQYQEYEGVLYTPFYVLSNLKRVKTFPMRADDVYFSGYLRTGTHWTYEIISMLVNGKAATIERHKDHLELIPAEKWIKLPSPRVIHGHMKLSDSPNSIVPMKIKVVYTVRDPKDVVVSLYNLYYGRLYSGSFADFLDLFLQGRIDINGLLDHLLDAERFHRDHPDVPFHFQVYEDTIKDPVLSVQKLSDFLGLKRNDELCKAIAEKCEFSRMKVDKDKHAAKMDGESFIYRNGTTGDWRNNFTEEMLEDYYRVYEKKMARSRFYQRYSREII